MAYLAVRRGDAVSLAERETHEANLLFEASQKSAKEAVEFADEVGRQSEILRRIGSFVGHDIGGPVSTMGASAGKAALRIRRTLDADSCSAVSEHLSAIDAIERDAERAVALLHDVAGFLKTTDGSLSVRAVSMTDAVRDAIDMADVQGDIRVDDLPSVMASQSIKIVLMNVIANAAKYSPGTPRIHVHARRLERLVHIMIDDRGIGIDEKHREEIFDLGRRLHTADSPFSGSGIGLASARLHAERMGGRIWCEGLEGGGSRFVIELEAAK